MFLFPNGQFLGLDAAGELVLVPVGETFILNQDVVIAQNGPYLCVLAGEVADQGSTLRLCTAAMAAMPGDPTIADPPTPVTGPVAIPTPGDPTLAVPPTPVTGPVSIQLPGNKRSVSDPEMASDTSTSTSTTGTTGSTGFGGTMSPLLVTVGSDNVFTLGYILNGNTVPALIYQSGASLLIGDATAAAAAAIESSGFTPTDMQAQNSTSMFVAPANVAAISTSAIAEASALNPVNGGDSTGVGNQGTGFGNQGTGFGNVAQS
jgi:hypothetical protein